MSLLSDVMYLTKSMTQLGEPPVSRGPAQRSGVAAITVGVYFTAYQVIGRKMARGTWSSCGYLVAVQDLLSLKIMGPLEILWWDDHLRVITLCWMQIKMGDWK